MKTTKTVLLSIALAGIMSACGSQKDEKLIGTWESSSPISVTEKIADATSASKSYTVDFIAPVENADGELNFTAVYDVNVPFVTDSTTNKSSYQVTATIKGTWTQEGSSDDDYLLTFDKNSLTVNGVDAPELGSVTDDFLNSLTSMTKIEDVEVTKDGKHLSFETDHPDRTYQFTRK